MTNPTADTKLPPESSKEYKPGKLFYFVSISGILLSVASVLYIIGFQISLTNTSKIYLPLTTLALGIILYLTGLNLSVYKEEQYIFSITLPWLIAGIGVIGISITGYPASWQVPSINYAIWYLLLTIAVLFSVTVTRFYTQMKGVTETPVSLEIPGKRHTYSWSDNLDADPLTIVEQDVTTLLVQIEDYKIELNELKRTNHKKTSGHLLQLLEITDYFERFSESIDRSKHMINPEIERYSHALNSIMRLHNTILINSGVVPISSPREVAIPGMHEIVSTEPRENLEDYTIIEEIERGYLWNGQLLRPSKVITVKN